MKTVSLEVDERIYPQIISFLRLLPEDLCHVFDEDDGASQEEMAAVQAIQARLLAGDDSEFVDWDEFKESL